MCEIEFWGSKRGVEYRLYDQIGFKLKTIRIRGFQRQFSLPNLLIPFELITSFFVVLFHFLIHRPDLVVGTGGYVSGPVVFTASRLGIKSIVHEQNSYPGATTRYLIAEAGRHRRGRVEPRGGSVQAEFAQRFRRSHGGFRNGQLRPVSALLENSLGHINVRRWECRLYGGRHEGI